MEKRLLGLLVCFILSTSGSYGLAETPTPERIVIASAGTFQAVVLSDGGESLAVLPCRNVGGWDFPSWECRVGANSLDISKDAGAHSKQMSGVLYFEGQGYAVTCPVIDHQDLVCTRSPN